MKRILPALAAALLLAPAANAGELDALFDQMHRDYLLGQFRAESGSERRAAFDRVLDASRHVLAEEPHSARAQLWGAVAWGLYGMSHSMIASARHGVADKIRRHATRLIEIDPQYENGAGYRLLGRLHTTVPRVPWVSMWVDQATGVDLLRTALATSRDDPRNLLFLAEALLDGPDDLEVRAEAWALLREAAAFRPRPDHPEEDAEAVALARQHLEELDGAGNGDDPGNDPGTVP